MKSASEYFKSQGLEVEVCELEVGDYLFNNKVCFEYKLISDFVSSIQSGRVFNQAIGMAETYPFNFVIIQGDEHTRAKCLAMSKNWRPISYYAYLGAIASLNRYVTVIESYTPFINESYYRMLINARKSLSKKPIVRKFEKKDKNPCFNWLAYCNYGLNAKRAQKIVEELELHTLTDLMSLNVEDLTQIQGIGETIANKIIEAIK